MFNVGVQLFVSFFVGSVQLFNGVFFIVVSSVMAVSVVNSMVAVSMTVAVD